MKEGTLGKIYSSKSKTFITFCFCFIIGVTISSGLDLKRELLFYFYLILLLIIFLFVLFTSRISIKFVFLCLLFISMGVIRTLLAKPIINKNHIAYYNKQSLEFIALVSQEPDVRTSYVNYTIRARDKYKGKVLMKYQLYPRYDYGDVLKIKCYLSPPVNFGGKFKYNKYLARYGIYSLCKYPQITKLAQDQGNILFKYIFKLKFWLAKKINLLWPEPQSSFMAGLLYGSRSGLPEQLTKNFNRTGITHIIAISGYNISIIVTVMMVVFINLGLYRQQAFWLTLIGIFVFVIFTGASASVTRAALMGSLVLLAQYLGRLSVIGNTMVFVLVLMLLINPLVLLYDSGFQLSFLATLGLVYLSPLLEKIICPSRLLKSKIVNSLLQTIVATLSAIIVTLPLIIYQFGRLSLVALLVNILVLWIIPFLMLFGFVAVILSVVFFPLGQVIAWLSGFGLDYVMGIANWFGQLSWSSVEVSMPIWLMGLIYVSLLFLVLKKNNN